MATRFFITVVLSGACFFGASWTGAMPTGFFDELNAPYRQYLGSSYFVQNDQKKPSGNVSIDDAPKHHENTNKPETSTQEKNVPQKIKPVKPFVPSEKIPVDQGVDFPYDI